MRSTGPESVNYHFPSCVKRQGNPWHLFMSMAILTVSSFRASLRSLAIPPAPVVTPLSTPRMRDSQLQPLASGGEGEPNGLEEGNKLTVGAAAQEKSTEEEMAEMEKSEADSAVGATTSVLVTRT